MRRHSPQRRNRTRSRSPPPAPICIGRQCPDVRHKSDGARSRISRFFPQCSTTRPRGWHATRPDSTIQRFAVGKIVFFFSNWHEKMPKNVFLGNNAKNCQFLNLKEKLPKNVLKKLFKIFFPNCIPIHLLRGVQLLVFEFHQRLDQLAWARLGRIRGGGAATAARAGTACIG